VVFTGQVPEVLMFCIQPMKPWSARMDRWSTCLKSASNCCPLGTAVTDRVPSRVITARRSLIA